MNDKSSATGPQSGGPVDPTEIDDLVAANRILADQGVLDGYGHVSMRHSGAADRYFLSRSRSPAILGRLAYAVAPTICFNSESCISRTKSAHVPFYRPAILTKCTHHRRTLMGNTVWVGGSNSIRSIK